MSDGLNKKFLFVVSLILIVSCAPKRQPAPYEPASPPTAKTQVKEGAREKGIASWYGSYWHGRQTASGEFYDMHDMTAAHKTLPFGTMVRVHNLQNDKTAVVRINDRGPFVEGRIIDLSYAAAQALDMVIAGVVPVVIEVIGVSPKYTAKSNFAVQVGSFSRRENAVRLKKELGNLIQENIYIADFNGLWRVRVGPFSSEEEGQKAKAKILKLGYDALLVRED